MEAAGGVPPVLRTVGREASRYWWIALVAGIAWIVVALVVLQFDQASINTVGIIIGLMFLATGAQNLLVAALVERGRWLPLLFGVGLVVAGIISLVRPEDTFAGVADILGFLFLLVATFWIVQAMVERDVNPLWWLGLIGGILMVILAFWTAGQFFITKAYILLVFAGAWSLMQGVRDIVAAFALRNLREL
jgi:uncharacterized membrane protein HdeD (DUF308 family)